jgi:phosphate-selective porin OprO/OprP
MMENRVLLGTSCVLALLAALPAVAQQPSLEDRVRTLEQMLGVPPPAGNQSLEDRVKAVEDALAQQNAQKEEADQMVRTRLSTLEQQVAETTISIDNSRPTISSADGRFQLSLRARIQFDGAFFSQDSNINATNAQFKDLASGAIVRRFYFGAEGRAFRDFWYEFRMDFGGANAEGNNAIINLARVAYNFGNLNNPNELHFRINAGIIQPLFTYGDSVSSSSTTFIERGDVVNTTIAGYGGDDHRRGVELTFQQSDIFRPGDNLVLSSAFTGQPTTPPAGAPTNTTDEGTQIVGRAAYRFWSDGFSNFQFGGNFAHIFNMTGTSGAGRCAQRSASGPSRNPRRRQSSGQHGEQHVVGQLRGSGKYSRTGWLAVGTGRRRQLAQLLSLRRIHEVRHGSRRHVHGLHAVRGNARRQSRRSGILRLVCRRQLDIDRREQDLFRLCYQQRDGDVQQSARDHAVRLERRLVGRVGDRRSL